MSFRSNVAQIFRGLSRAFAFARITLGNLLVVIVVAVIALALFSPSDRKIVANGSALYLAPNRIVEANTQVDPFTAFAGGLPTGAETRLADILTALDRASGDGRIAELVINPSNLFGTSPAQLEAIGEAIEHFRQSGKRVTAFGSGFGRDQYYLASFADDIYADPYGDVLPSGYGLIGTYFGEFFKRYGINVRVFRTGRYKSTVEPYTQTGPSDDTRESHQAVVDELWSRYVDRVAANRGLKADVVRDLFERIDEAVVEFDGDTPRFAYESGLIDQLLTNDAVQARLVESLGSESGTFRHVSVADYLAGDLPPFPQPNTVGVVSGNGVILPGRQPRGAIGAANLARLIRRARDDDDVRALVMRLDSPGGSAFASEQIRRELELFQQSGRPVVVSMGSTAASGGYWIAATADQIWAAPSTITGSIGVFSMIPTFEETLGNFGVFQEGVVAGPLVGELDPFGGVSDRMATILQTGSDLTYRRFVNTVARGRDLTPEAVEAVAQGRIWTGSQALEHGLVDGLGHLDDAIAAAAELASMPNYTVRDLVEPLTPGEFLMRQMSDTFSFVGIDLGFDALRHTVLFPAALEWLDRFERFARLSDPAHTYAICTSCDLTR